MKGGFRHERMKGRVFFLFNNTKLLVHIFQTISGYQYETLKSNQPLLRQTPFARISHYTITSSRPKRPGTRHIQTIL
jgi:hypothetical protein